MHLDQQTLVLPDGSIRAFRNWITCYTEGELVALVERFGFRVIERNALLADEQIDDASLNVGLVVEKPGGG